MFTRQVNRAYQISWPGGKVMTGQEYSQKRAEQLEAAVLVCNQWVIFESDLACIQWATNVVQQIYPEIKIRQPARLEVIVGRWGGDNHIQTNMRELLALIMTRAGLDQQHCHIEIFDKEINGFKTRVWGVLALRP
jgi:hypothetical protein